jgi:hypothetical protein
MRSFILAAALAFASVANGQCGAGSPDARVTGSGNSYTASKGSNTLYTGSDYRRAIQTALDSIGAGQRVSVIASGSIGANTISISSGKTFEGCGTINVGNRRGRGAIESLNTNGVKIPYLIMTGNPSFGLRFHGVRDLTLGTITMNLTGGMGIRFDRDAPWNYNVKIGTVTVRGASSHAVETFNIDGFDFGAVYAQDVGESGLLIQTSRNGRVGLVDGNNAGAGTGYATFRMANRLGRTSSNRYDTNIFVNKVVSRGGGRGIFCVSESGGVEIGSVDLARNGGNAILIENCYNLSIRGGTVNGGGEVRLAARSEFANNRDISINLRVDGTTVRESPCGTNIRWTLSGNGRRDIC